MSEQTTTGAPGPWRSGSRWEPLTGPAEAAVRAAPGTGTGTRGRRPSRLLVLLFSVLALGGGAGGLAAARSSAPTPDPVPAVPAAAAPGERGDQPVGGRDHRGGSGRHGGPDVGDGWASGDDSGSGHPQDGSAGVGA
ncbi:hypothetical protein SAMN04488543_1531 [Friedmanniella luteola]|uniref:Uncharacterized protein n=1 Tax=Friedmanniella luteola TaxID=546871 RepID=A0A1H1RCW2_9ACTN|nr:hypothetical protein [Friedmanniella luteola]SDS33525.1 hypothetical protein SAMN04488543_1531 [Friedmanniella luteola]